MLAMLSHERPQQGQRLHNNRIISPNTLLKGILLLNIPWKHNVKEITLHLCLWIFLKKVKVYVVHFGPNMCFHSLHNMFCSRIEEELQTKTFFSIRVTNIQTTHPEISNQEDLYLFFFFPLFCSNIFSTVGALVVITV